MLRLALLSLALPLVACGGSVTEPSGNDSGASDSGVADAKSDAPAPTVCPTSLPAADSACSREGLACEYATDPRPGCHVVATCTGGKWSEPPGVCPPLPGTTCPPTRAAAAGATCSPLDAYCDYAGLTCRCTNCVFYPIERCEGPLTWHCDAPNPDATCPAARPLLGTACSTAGQQCDYGCEPGLSRKCEGGVWIKASSPGGCPVSTRDAKHDIHYLKPGELESLAREALAMPLATWRYDDKALGDRTHVGIILEDAPGSPAVDGDKNMVDLYGYSTMSLAAAQSNAKKIETLEKRIERLEKALESCKR